MFTFFGGKGGVGKTTCAAAAAVRAAREGARVLVVSTDPAHSLGDALATKLGREAREVESGLFAAQLDADLALGKWVDERENAFRTIAERGTYLDDEDVERLLSLSLPGVDELVGLLELRRLARVRDYDRVVVDTAPTGHTLRLLEMPESLRRFAEVLDDMHAKHRFLASSLGGRWRPDFADEVIGEVERDAGELRALLTDGSRTSFTWITLFEPLPLDETEDGIRALSALGVLVDTIVANRVWPSPDRACHLCTPRVAAESACRTRLARTYPRARILEVPAAVEEPRGLEALSRLSLSVREHGGAEERREKLMKISVPPLLRVDSPLPFPPEAKLVLFGGKGGVGKTTCAAACAVEVAKAHPKKKVLVLSTDPAHSLGDAFDCELDDVPRKVPGASANLAAREIDARSAFEAQRERYQRAIDDLFSSIFKGRMDATFDRRVLEDLLDMSPPGIDELVAILSIVDAQSNWDLVIVDTAPTGHTLRLLALPEKALEWVHALMQIILKYRRVVGLGELASDLTDLAKRLRALIALLADTKRCAFVAVARPAVLPRLETDRLVHRLEELGVPLSAIVANAVTDGECSRCASTAKAERPELVRLRRLGPTIEAGAIFPAPRGAKSLLAWRRSWRK